MSPATAVHLPEIALPEQAHVLIERDGTMPEASRERLSSARGILFGALLGTGMWAVLGIAALFHFAK